MKLLDLTQILDETTPVYPGDRKTIVERYTTIKNDGYTTTNLEMCVHTGTHVEVPMHLVPDLRTVSDFALETFIGKGLLLDVRGEVEIQYKDVYETMVEEDAVVLLYTGVRPELMEEHPVVSEELAKFFIRKKIKMLGMDLPSPDFEPFDIHTLLMDAGIILLENCANLDRLEAYDDYFICATPLKIVAEASPVRAYAVIKK